MTAALTLSFYIVRQFALSVTAMLLALSGLVAMFDFIELLRRSASHPEVSFGLVSQIAALRLPYVAMQILPFADPAWRHPVLLAPDAVVGTDRRPRRRHFGVGVPDRPDLLRPVVRRHRHRPGQSGLLGHAGRGRGDGQCVSCAPAAARWR